MGRTKPPTAVGAERYLITCCLNEPDAVLELASKIEASDFYNDLYRHTYQVCSSLVTKELVPEPMTVYNQLDKLNLAKPDDLRELELLSRASYDVNNLDAYVAELRSAAVRRTLIDTQRECAEALLADKNSMTPDDAIALCEAKLLSVSARVSNVESVHRMGDGARELLEIRASNPVAIPGLPTGFPSLDQEIQGLQGGRLYVLAARYKTGKSIFLMNIAAHVAVSCGVPVLMIDTENPSPHVEDRMLSLLSGIEETSIRNGTFVNIPGAAERLEEAIAKLDKAEIYHHYMPNFTFEACMALIKRYKVQKGIGLVIFDYIKMPENADTYSQQEYQLLGQLTTDLKNKVAGALNLPVVTAAQLGRKAIGQAHAEDDHVADSDRIGRYANCLFYFRQKTEDEQEKYGYGKHTGNMVLTCHINRDGPAKQFAYDIYFDRPVMSMTEVRARKL